MMVAMASPSEASIRPPASGRATAVAVLLVVALGAALRLYRVGSQPLWVDEATSLRFARQSLSQLWSWGTLVDPGTPRCTTHCCMAGWCSETAKRLCGSCRWCSVCSRSRSCTHSGGRSATIDWASSAPCCSPSHRSRSGTRRKRARTPSSPWGRRRRCWVSPCSFVTPSERCACARPAGHGSRTCWGRRSRSSHTTRPSSCRSEPTSWCWAGGGDTDAARVASCGTGCSSSSPCSACGPAGCRPIFSRSLTGSRTPGSRARPWGAC